VHREGRDREEKRLAGMILGAKFISWDIFPWFSQKRDFLFLK
jgi:hypothetical protein